MDNLSKTFQQRPKGIELKHKQCEVPRQVQSPTGWCTFIISWPCDPWPSAVQVRVIGRRHRSPSLHRVSLTTDQSVFLCTFCFPLLFSWFNALLLEITLTWCAFRCLPYVFQTICFLLAKWNSSGLICNLSLSSPTILQGQCQPKCHK